MDPEWAGGRVTRPNRGEYRSVHVVLLDGPDYQGLSPEARLVFLTLKLTAGSTGIWVQPGAAHVLAERTGLAPERVESALTELVAAPGDWLQRERNTLWVVRHLEFEPSLTVANANHRAYVADHLAGLPRLAIVDRFRRRYAAWLPTPSKAVPTAPKGGGDTIPMVSPSHPDAIPITTSTSTSTSTNTSTTRETAAAAAVAYLTRCVVALNAGLAANPALTGFREVSASEQAGRVTWEADGIPVEVAERVVREVASRYQPTPRARQPNSLRYFDAAVREAHERAGQPKGAAPPSANPFDAVIAKLDQEAARATG